jgi:hypothetical protein
MILLLHSPPDSHRNNIFARCLTILIICASVLLLGAPAFSQDSALTLPRNLGELVGESQVVVQGSVTSVALEPHAQLKNLMTVVVTVQVEEALKGQPGTVYTFRQAVIHPRDQRQKMGYQPGQHVLLLVMKPSQYGLTSTAGLNQGRFRIEAGADGKLQATNGAGNLGLFRGLNQHVQTRGLHLTPEAQALATRTEGGPVPLEQLKSLIRILASEK